MPDHKFEPFQRVLVRDGDIPTWNADFFSRVSAYFGFVCIGGCWEECIPYTDETAHLLGTSQPYEPPKEYGFGDKVEVCVGGNGVWRKGIFVKNKRCTSQPFVVAVQGYDDTMCVNANEIRTLTT